MATMNDIAKLAGVSRGTVDRVINRRGTVNPETEKKVREIAELLDYRPNKAGVALAAQKKRLKIGVILFGSQNAFFDEVMEGLNAKLEELSIYGCTVLARRIPFDPAIQIDTIDELTKEGISGLIISPCSGSLISERINRLWKNGIPCITVNTDLPESGRIAYVGSDPCKCGQTAAGLLKQITNGSARVGIVTGSHNVLGHEERIRAFLEYFSKAPCGITVVDIAENQDDDYKSYEAVSAMISKHPDLSALYFTAAGVYGGCRAVISSGLSGKLKIITFDDVPTTREMIKKGLISATICQQPHEQGALSLSLLVDYLLTGTAPKTVYHYMDLIIKIKENL